jgi:DNA polymerase I-like protein with 3'-5' exonuclease and polymerase domains
MGQITVALDTETFLISPGCGAPPMVCLQYAFCEGLPSLNTYVGPPHLEHVTEARKHFEHWLDQGFRLVGHNVAFDLCVAAAQWPDLLPPIFEALATDRVTDTKIRDQLLDLASGDLGRKGGYSLAECCQRRTGRVLDKSDPWRLRYGTIAQKPVQEWPEEAKKYALLDATATAELFRAQEQFPDLLQDQYRQTRAAFWLRLMELWGLKTDPEATAKFYEKTLETLQQAQKTVTLAGLARLNGTRDTKAAQAYAEAVFQRLGEPMPLTPTGKPKLDEDVCNQAADPVLTAYQVFGASKTLISRAKRLRRGETTPLQAGFEVLKETGRTSCKQGNVKRGESPPSWGFQLQNVPAEEGLRECFIPRPGFVFCSVDYDGFELRTWAQVCLWTVGRSRLAEVLNDGGDPHAALGATLAGQGLAEFSALLKAKDKTAKDFRSLAKIPNFGYPGGMGPATLRTQARTSYGVHLTLGECENLRNAWRSTWPEAVEYFKWISQRVVPGDAPGTACHFKSQRVRGGLKYTVACNTFFQGLAADAAKAAGFALSRECYTDKSSPLFGSRIVNFVHDEFILEIPESQAHEAAQRQAEIQVREAQKWVPDVTITASPALMRRWSKAAFTAYNAAGRLIPWEDA